MTNFDYDRAGELQYSINKSWIPFINARYHMGLDGISLPLIALTILVVPLCIIYSWNHFPEPQNPKAFLILILILETGMVGSFLAEDLILFFVFFEVVLLPMYFLIGVWGGEQRQYASIKFFLYTLFGSALMIVSFLALYFLSDKVMIDGVLGAHLRHDAAAGGGVGHLDLRGAADLRRHVHGLRHQGADLPVPHLAARRPHPGPDGRLGHPGRRAAEARHLRLRPHRPADPARTRPARGLPTSEHWRSSASSTAPCAAWPRPT